MVGWSNRPVDACQIPLRRLTARRMPPPGPYLLRLGALLLAGTALAGCRARPTEQARQKAAQKVLKKLEKPSAPLVVESTDSSFNVADPQGNRLMDARVKKME